MTIVSDHPRFRYTTFVIANNRVRVDMWPLNSKASSNVPSSVFTNRFINTGRFIHLFTYLTFEIRNEKQFLTREKGANFIPWLTITYCCKPNYLLLAFLIKSKFSNRVQIINYTFELRSSVPSWSLRYLPYMYNLHYEMNCFVSDQQWRFSI